MSLIDKNIINPKDLSKIYVIFGATASGKSKIAVSLAHKINGIIINADSSQIYQEFPILSNIPTQLEQEGIPHKLFAIKSILEDFNLMQWLELVAKEINNAKAINKTPIIVGGTGLYLKALIEGVSDIPSNIEAKQEAQNTYDKLGYEKFFNLIARIDPDFVKKIIDPHRLIRMYEVYLITNKSILDLQKNKVQPIEANFINFFINRTRDNLYDKINQRFLNMLEFGAIDEVKNFIANNPKHVAKLSKILGGTQIYDFLQNKINRNELILLGSQATRHYAKRQLTWYRGNFLYNLKVINF